MVPRWGSPSRLPDGRGNQIGLYCPSTRSPLKRTAAQLGAAWRSVQARAFPSKCAGPHNARFSFCRHVPPRRRSLCRHWRGGRADGQASRPTDSQQPCRPAQRRAAFRSDRPFRRSDRPFKLPTSTPRLPFPGRFPSYHTLKITTLGSAVRRGNGEGEKKEEGAVVPAGARRGGGGGTSDRSREGRAGRQAGKNHTFS